MTAPITLADLIHASDLPERELAACLACVCSRGKRKGRILANPPSMDRNPDAYVAYQALISAIAPPRISISGLIAVRALKREGGDLLELWRRVDAWASAWGMVLEPAAGGAMEFSMSAMHRDWKGERERLQRLRDAGQLRLDTPGGAR